jgi:hypothetical protein
MTRRDIKRAPKIFAGALETKRENVLKSETENATKKI